MKARIAVLGIGPLLDAHYQMLKELLVLGLDSFYYQTISGEIALFQETVQKCIAHADVIFCLGNKIHLPKRVDNFFSLPILWIAEDYPLCKELISGKYPMRSSLVSALQKALIRDRKTLALAESCTGGYLSHLLTSQSGSSQYFLGSLITYSNDLKKNLLGVQQETLDNYGAVSSETVREMAEGVLRQTIADFSIAVSGVAGPEGGTEQNPVGSVWIAIGVKNGVIESQKFQIQGNRSTVISVASFQAISLLLAKLLD